MCQNLSGISISSQSKATALHPARRVLAPLARAEPGALPALGFPET